jgi:integrase
VGLGKQAKTLTKAQVEAVLNRLSNTRHPARNRAILLLSIKAGLRAKEIASLTWDMVTTSDGEVGTSIHRKRREHTLYSSNPLGRSRAAVESRGHPELAHRFNGWGDVAERLLR